MRREPLLTCLGTVRVREMHRHLRGRECLGVVELLRDRQRLVRDASFAFVIRVVEVGRDSRENSRQPFAVTGIDARQRLLEQGERVRLQH